MRFEKDWDTCLIEQFENCNHIKPIISVYPSDFDSPSVQHLQMCSNGFNSQGVPLFKARACKKFKRPTISNFWAAGFSFSSGSLIEECPYELRIGDVFFGEEVFQMSKFFK